MYCRMVVIYRVIIPQDDPVLYDIPEFQCFSGCYFHWYNVRACPENIYFRIQCCCECFKVEPVDRIRPRAPVPCRTKGEGGLFVVGPERFKEAVGKKCMFPSFNLNHLLIQIIKTEGKPSYSILLSPLVMLQEQFKIIIRVCLKGSVREKLGIHREAEIDIILCACIYHPDPLCLDFRR